MTPYFFKQMRKRTGLCLVVVLTALAFSLALCMLQRSRGQMAARIEEVYDNLEVRCSVTNLTGTQSDRLNLPEWVLRLFTTGMTTGNFQEDGLFTPHVRDVQVRSTVYCTQPGGTVPHALSGITGLAADSALQPDSGCTILWREGFDASVFQGRGYSLLLPEELAAWEDEDGYVTLEFSPSSGETEQHRFLVVGTYAGGAGRLYCPWWVARQLCLDVYGAITMDSLSAAMADNRRIDQFWDEYGSRYFVEPTRDGTPVPWEGREFERVLPASSVANLYPFNYSGKTDPNGFYIGKDKYGSNIVVDFDRRDSDKTSANILILGNSGQGKSYLIKLLICNMLEAGKSVIALDAEHELEELCENLGGCFIDLMAGEKRINVLEVRSWNEDTDKTAPETFRKSTLLARHISFLKDFFRAYKDFSDPQLDTIEIMLSKLYARWGITEETDLRQLAPGDYPILSDLYDLMQEELAQYKPGALYTQELLQEVLLGLHSLCVGADAPFFNGHTNISGDRFLVFGVGGVLTAAKSLRNALLFNVLAYMSDRLLTGGNTVAVLDELYLWLSNPVAIEYIRNCLKRVRKRDSALVMASQNLEDFDQEGVREMTKPLFAIPPHQFLFNPGSIGKRFYMDMLQLDEAEFELIQRARRGECLYKCGMERYHLEVKAPTHKAVLFGSAGGR